MDSKVSGRMGGLKRVSNMGPQKLKEANRKASRASWRGHKKGNKLCSCPRCKKKYAKTPHKK